LAAFLHEALAMSQPLELFSARACPYAQRTRLVLGEKGVPLIYTEIDLQNKPDWFQQVSLYTKVPALRHGALTLYESAILNEYVDEVFPAPPLLPGDPGGRALARIWIDFANTRVVPAFGKLLRGATAAEQEEGRRELDAAFELIEREALAKLSEKGPFWFGEHVSLVDYSFYPWFERLPALVHYRGYKLPPLERLARWQHALAERPAVKQVANTPAYYIERFASVAQPAAAAAAR
jgi:glutathione S-transferase